MKTLVTNFKSLVLPKCFLPLTFQKAGGMVGYVMLSMLIAVVLFEALPTFLGGSVTEMADSMETELPDFYYKDGQLSFGFGEEYLWQNDQNLIYICTAVESFNSDDDNYFANVLDDMTIQNALPPKAIFLSRTDCMFVQNGDVGRMSLEEILSQLDITSFDKAQFIDSMSTLMYVILSIGLVFIFIGSIVGIFFFALIWGLIAFLINRFQRIKYSYGRMYRLAVYVMVPMRILKMLCTQFLPLPSGIVSWVFTGLILLYLILALFCDGNQKMVLQGSRN